MSDPKHKIEELEVFLKFVKIAGLTVDVASIRQPDFPDIVCQLDNGEALGFELTAITEEEFAAKFARGISLKQSIESFYNNLPPSQKNWFDNQFNNALLYFDFRKDISNADIKKNLNAIFRLLLETTDDYEGDVDFKDSSGLNQMFNFLSVSRGAMEGPIFDVAIIAWTEEPIVPAVHKKLNHHYRISLPIHLLLYSGFGPTFPKNVWVPQLEAYLNDRGSLSPFQKIWVVDLDESKIEFVRSAVNN
jgi:hypothetical protein